MKPCLFLFSSFLILFMSVGSTRAQMGMGKPSEIEEMKKRRLLVILEAPNTALMSKLKKKGKEEYIVDYNAAVEEFNSNLKHMMKTYWPYHDSITYTSYSSVQSKLKAKSDRYAVIWIATVSGYSTGTQTVVTYEPGLNWSYDDVKGGVEESKEGDRDLDATSYFIVTLIEDFNKQPIFRTGLPRSFPLKADLLFAVQNCTWYIDSRLADQKASDVKGLIKKNAARLKDYTLLINENDVSEKSTETSFKVGYPYPFKIVDAETFDIEILDQREATAYMMVVPYISASSQGVRITYLPVVMDARKGDVLAYVMPTAGSLLASMTVSSSYGNAMVTDRVMKEVAEDVMRALK